eukprot:2955035-Heterocapsa_arctica.AAC.1
MLAAAGCVVPSRMHLPDAQAVRSSRNACSRSWPRSGVLALPFSSEPPKALEDAKRLLVRLRPPADVPWPAVHTKFAFSQCLCALVLPGQLKHPPHLSSLSASLGDLVSRPLPLSVCAATSLPVEERPGEFASKAEAPSCWCWQTAKGCTDCPSNCILHR